MWSTCVIGKDSIIMQSTGEKYVETLTTFRYGIYVSLDESLQLYLCTEYNLSA